MHTLCLRNVYMMISLSILYTQVYNKGFAVEPPHQIATVTKLTHLAVILPELQIVQDDWQCALWTPTVGQVAAAEKAVLLQIKEYAQVGVKVSDAEATLKSQYVIQYYGVYLHKRKWIICSIVNINTLYDAVMYSGDPEDDLAYILVGLLTGPYEEYDTDNWRDAFYDPLANVLSGSMGFVRSAHNTAHDKINEYGGVKQAGNRSRSGGVSVTK